MAVTSRHKMQQQSLFVGLLLLALISSPVWAKPVLKLAYIEFPPYYYTDASGEPRGHLIDLSRVLAHSAGYDLDIRSLPARRAAQMLAAGEMDFWLGLATITEQAEQVLVSTTVVDTISFRIYSLSPLPKAINKTDLRNSKVVMLRGYHYGGWADFVRDPVNNIDYYMANNHLQAVKTLIGREYNYLLDYKLPVQRVLEFIDSPPLYEVDVFSLDVHILVSARHAQAQRLLRQFESAYLSLGDNNPVLSK